MPTHGHCLCHIINGRNCPTLAKTVTTLAAGGMVTLAQKMTLNDEAHCTCKRFYF